MAKTKVDKELKITITILSIIVIIIGLLSVYIIAMYNTLNFKKEKTSTYKQNVIAIMQKKVDYLQLLSESLSSFTVGENDIFDNIKKQTDMLNNQKNFELKITQNNELYDLEKELIDMAYNNSSAKYNENFRELYNNYAYIEDKLNSATYEYNDLVSSYNKDLTVFPKNLIANVFKFTPISTIDVAYVAVESIYSTEQTNQQAQLRQDESSSETTNEPNQSGTNLFSDEREWDITINEVE